MGVTIIGLPVADLDAHDHDNGGQKIGRRMNGIGNQSLAATDYAHIAFYENHQDVADHVDGPDTSGTFFTSFIFHVSLVWLFSASISLSSTKTPFINNAAKTAMVAIRPSPTILKVNIAKPLLCVQSSGFCVPG